MKAALRYVALGVVLYALFVLLMVPASWLYGHGLQSRLGGVTLYGVKGTLWSGRAAALRAPAVQVDNLRWRLHPWTLLWGRAEAALNFDYQNAPGTLVAARSLSGNWYARDVDLELPATQLMPMLRMPGAELGGRLMLHLDSLTVKQGQVTAAEGTLTWEKAALRQPLAVALGSFVITLQTTAQGVNGVLIDRGGAIQAQGVFKLQPDGQYQVTATFTSRDPKLAQGLRLFGSPGPDGRVNYSATGRLPALLPG
jgi:hypothetical protein